MTLRQWKPVRKAGALLSRLLPLAAMLAAIHYGAIPAEGRVSLRHSGMAALVAAVSGGAHRQRWPDPVRMTEPRERRVLELCGRNGRGPGATTPTRSGLACRNVAPPRSSIMVTRSGAPGNGEVPSGASPNGAGPYNSPLLYI